MEASYSRRTMRAGRNPYPIPSRGFFLFMVIFGGAEGLGINLLHAPFWTFYVAPFLMAPFLVWELLRLDAEHRRNEKAKSAGPSRPRESSQRVA
jgi:hypothetical protein